MEITSRAKQNVKKLVAKVIKVGKNSYNYTYFGCDKHIADANTCNIYVDPTMIPTKTKTKPKS